MGAFCAFCGRLATGYAMIDDLRYCHGDDDPTPTCYEQGTWDIAHGTLDGVTNRTVYFAPYGPVWSQ